MSIVFRQLVDHPSGALSYLLADMESRHAVLIDPLPDDGMLLSALLDDQGLALQAVIRTHVHDQSECTVAPRLQAGGPPVAGHPSECGQGCQPLHHGDQFVFGNEVLHVIGTPGHTPGSLSFLWRDRVFCGDSLWPGACPPCADAPADPGTLFDSVTQRLFTLPGETLLYPGHMVQGRTVSSVAEERLHNPAFGGRQRSEFLHEQPWQRPPAVGNAGAARRRPRA